MPRRLSDDEKRLRRLKDGEMADECGHLQAAIAAIRAEAIRRELRRAEGLLFTITLSPPGRHQRLDRKALELKIGAAALEPCLYTVETDWQMRCTARRRAAVAG